MSERATYLMYFDDSSNEFVNNLKKLNAEKEAVDVEKFESECRFTKRLICLYCCINNCSEFFFKVL